jgi:hypothetical protein
MTHILIYALSFKHAQTHAHIKTFTPTYAQAHIQTCTLALRHTNSHSH